MRQPRQRGRSRTRGGRNESNEYSPLEPRGPSVDTLSEAIEAITTHDVPGVPGVDVIETIQSAAGFPFSAGTRTIRDVSVTAGDATHGARRSADHVSFYKVVLPVRELQYDEVDMDAIDLERSTGVPEPSCGECGCRGAVYIFRAHHHQSARSVAACKRCESIFHDTE